jgi:hypothetical protein
MRLFPFIWMMFCGAHYIVFTILYHQIQYVKLGVFVFALVIYFWHRRVMRRLDRLRNPPE